MVVFGDYLYAEASNAITGGEIWRTKGVGGPPFTDWEQVNTNGFGDSNNEDVSPCIVFSGYLYAGTDNGITGGEIWRTKGVGGPPFTDWEQVNTDGFGDNNNSDAIPIAVFGGYLYAGTSNAITGGEIWRTKGIGGPLFTDWEQVNTNGFGDVNNIEIIPKAAIFGDYLYVEVTNNSTGGEIWRAKGIGGPPFTDWEQVNTDGFGDSNNGDLSLQVFGGYLYAGTENEVKGGEIWRTKGIGGPLFTDWEQVNTDGFGDSNNEGIFTTVVFSSYIYAGTENVTTGGGIWRSLDGTKWEQVNTDGFGDANNNKIVPLVVFGDYLYAGTDNETGAGIWRTIGDVAVTFGDYFPIDLQKYGIKTFQWTFGESGQFSNRIEGTEIVPYISGEISGAKISIFSDANSGIIFNDGVNVKFLGYDDYYLSTDCSLTDHPSVWSFNTLNDGMIIDQGTYYWINKNDFSDCEIEDNQMLLINIQDVTVIEGTYKNAVIIWFLDTNYPFKSLYFQGNESDLGITLPTSSDTNGYSVTAFDIYGFETGPIAIGDISASTGLLNELYVLVRIETPSITVNPSTGLTTTESGVTAAFTLVLTVEPTATVTINITSSDETEGTISPTSLTFTSQNWNVPQTVTIMGVHDDLNDGDIAYTIITDPAISDDIYYNGLDPENVSVTNKDHDLSDTVGSSGDTVEVTDPDNDLFGFYCEIPQDALDTDTTITIDKVDDPPAFPSGIQLVGNVVDFGAVGYSPGGLTFKFPVTIGLTYPADVNPDVLHAYIYDTLNSKWVEVSISSVDKEKRRILIETSHFSLYALGQILPTKQGDGDNGGCFISTTIYIVN